MKLKRNALWALLAGFLIVLAGVAMPLAVLYLISQNPRTGIIGGAGAPTLQFRVFQTFGVLPYTLVLLGVAVMISAVFCLLFSKTVQGHCGLKTSLVSLGLSATGAAGLCCVLIWIACVAFGGAPKHYPVRYPLSIALGMVCLCVFILLGLLYCKLREGKWSIRGVVIDVLTSILYLPAFFFAFNYLYALVD